MRLAWIALPCLLVACKPDAAPPAIPPAAPVEAMELPQADDFDDDDAEAPAAASLTETYADLATEIRRAAHGTDVAHTRLRTLAVEIGARPAGSKALTKAIGWAKDELAAARHDNIRVEPVKVRGWRRGAESLRLGGDKLDVLGLGGTVPTQGGLRAEVVVVSDFEELQAKADRVDGRIVLFDVKMHLDAATGYPNYGVVAPYRRQGPSRAAKLGAKAVLLRSLTTDPKSPPHTGAIDYDPDAPKIPAAAVSWPAADAIVAAAAEGPTKVTLRLSSKDLGEVDSANVVAEVRGQELPDEVVVIGGHLDSWDVGQGAQDNGAGVVIAMAALDVLRGLKTRPRRTIRLVLWTAEEQYGAGALAYAEAHGTERHAAALESDTGAAPVMMLSLQTKDTPMGPPGSGPVQPELTEVRQIAQLFAGDGVRGAMTFFAGSDVQPLVRAGVPAIGLLHDPRHYFDVHHSDADVFDVVDPVALQQAVTVLATTAYILADLPEPLGS